MILVVALEVIKALVSPSAFLWWGPEIRLTEGILRLLTWCGSCSASRACDLCRRSLHTRLLARGDAGGLRDLKGVPIGG